MSSSNYSPDEQDEDAAGEIVSVVRRSQPNGPRVYLFKQDPTVHHTKRLKWFPDEILPGPRTEDCVICGVGDVPPSDEFGNFLYDPQYSPIQFDAIQSLVVVTNVLRMFRQLDKKRSLHWQWGYECIQIYPRMGEALNAFYSREQKALCFYYYPSNTGDTIYTARSFDIVAHETGHAILDGLKPNWNGSRNPYTNALHESFGDLTAIFSILDDFEMCESVIAHSRGNLHTRTFFPAIAEEFGNVLGLQIGLRNADQDFCVTQVSSESHELSQVFTSAIYDILSDVFDLHVSPSTANPAMTLYTVGKRLLTTLLTAIIKAPSKDANFYHVATLMMKNEPSRSTRRIMKMQFKRRQILDKQLIDTHNESTIVLNPGALCGYVYKSLMATGFFMREDPSSHNIFEVIIEH